MDVEPQDSLYELEMCMKKAPDYGDRVSGCSAAACTRLLLWNFNNRINVLLKQWSGLFMSTRRNGKIDLTIGDTGYHETVSTVLSCSAETDEQPVEAGSFALCYL
jgi:hypothetical protein